MIIKRYTLPYLNEIFTKLGQLHFDIETQYKLLKLKNSLKEEEEIYNEQVSSLREYCEQDEQGNIIQNDNGGYKIKQDKIQECQALLDKINNLQIQIPDIYFTLDELKPLNLTFNELDVLMPFVKL